MLSTFVRLAASMTGFFVVVLSTSKQIPEWFVTTFDQLRAHSQLSYIPFLSSRISHNVIEKIKIESLRQIYRVNNNNCYYYCYYY